MFILKSIQKLVVEMQNLQGWPWNTCLTNLLRKIENMLHFHWIALQNGHTAHLLTTSRWYVLKRLCIFNYVFHACLNVLHSHCSSILAQYFTSTVIVRIKFESFKILTVLAIHFLLRLIASNCLTPSPFWRNIWGIQSWLLFCSYSRAYLKIWNDVEHWWSSRRAD